MKTVRSVCPYCGVGCGIVMTVGDDGQVAQVRGDPDHPANRGRLCTKGQTCAQALSAPGRLTQAFVREARAQDPVPLALDAAIADTARRLRHTIDTHGPDSVALYVSGQMSLEAQYLANKLAKGYICTPHIESNSRLCMASAGSGYKGTFGADAPPGSYDDFDHADLFFVIGANMADCHPILYLRMMDRVKAGAKLVVVDPRRTPTADKAHLHLPIRPGTDLVLLNGLLHLLALNGHTDPAFIAAHTEGWDAMPALLADYPPATVAALTGLPEAQIRQVADWIGQTPNWMSCWTMGLNQSTQGTAHTHAVCNLHLATGALCRTGSGPFSLTGQPNAMGGRDMGYMGPGLPGQRSALSAADRRFVEDHWQLPPGTLRADAGQGTVALFDALAAGDVKACWIICTNPVATVPDRQRVIAGLQAAELVIVQDAFLDTETTRHADILLPGALWAEGEGVMVNSERNLTLAPQAVAAPGDALPDWALIARVARAMGYTQGFNHTSAAEVFDEIRAFANPATGYDIGGASHERLREAPLQWPCPVGDPHSRHPIRYRVDGGLRFATPSGKARFVACPHQPPAEPTDDAYPLVLNTGRVQHQWHTRTKTGRITTLNRLNPGPFIEIHPDDAAAHGLAEQAHVLVRSRRGQAVLPARLTDRVPRGQCFVPFHWNDCFGDNLAINAVTGNAVDPVSLQPALKSSAVRIGPAPSVAGRAMPAAGQQPEAAPALSGVAVLWASQTGKAEAFATRCAERLRAEGHAVTLGGMDRFPAAGLAGAQQILLLASTFGDGEPPEHAQGFWSQLQAEAAPPLAGTPFAVLAFGDPAYDRFCGFGRQLDARLETLGGQRLLPRTDCEPDHEADASQWLERLVHRLAGRPLPAGDAPATERPRPRTPAPPGVGRQNPLPHRLVIHRRLSGPGASKDVRQFGFDLRGSALRYEAGDALGVWPRNDPALVNAVLAATGLPREGSVALPGVGERPWAEALAQHLDITRLTPEQLRFVAERSGDTGLAARLQGPADALAGWLQGRQLIDLLRAHPVRAGAADWLGVLKRLQPRLYSIASSPRAEPDTVQLTVSVVRYHFDGQPRGGLCSTFLADRAGDTDVPLFVQPAPHFRPPTDPAAPLIMIGPGTGIAPFRGFLQERQATGASGRNWLFFGEQHAATDFYYRDELAALQRQGVLHRLDTAFSRDQADKLYVQHRIAEHGATLWAWLQDGAHLRICGDASRMAKDVDAALRQVAQTHGGLGPDAATAYLAQLARDQRYQRDVY